MRDFHFPGRSAVWAENGMCATSHPLASQVAIDILKKGGNAMDAAIAGAVLLGICEPQMTGIGGDCFVLFSPAGSNDIKAINGSGCAPQGLNAELLRDQGLDTIPIRSVHTVSIPAAIDAFCQLSEDWGKLGIADSLAPAIHYATNGVPLHARVAMDLATQTADLHPTALRDYSKNGAPFAIGDKFAAPKQAEVLKRIAAQGRDGFYTGEIAEDMVTSLQALGGLHTLDDFQNQRAFYTSPVSGHYNGVDLVEHPPNGQGATALLILNILSHFDLASLDPYGAERAHLEAEATKLAYDARNRFIADPQITSALEHMLAPETAQKLAALIDRKSVITGVQSVTEAVHKDTVYITVVDRDQMAVSLIYSIFHGFGSGIASDKFGILFQNRGAGFNLTAGHPNELGGGKRPMHTIIPGMLAKNGRPMTSFGVMGGQYQPTGHVRYLTNTHVYGMDPQTAIDAPRCFAEGDMLKIERGYSQKTIQELADLGHVIDDTIGPLGGAQSITMHDSGLLEGASDPRKDGCALGY